MSSIQAPTTAWMAYSDATILPPTSVYVGPYRLNEPESYEKSVERQPDRQLAEALQSLSSPFLTSYLSFSRVFTEDDYYTLFLPLDSSVLEGLLDVQENAAQGYSYKDRKFKAEAKTRIEDILMNHMVSVKINPQQIQYRNTRITAINQNVIHINEQGEINDGVSVVQQYIILPNCVIYLISKEIL
jgi:uncharacterized surface protein with fasciclin (FAS1) repeats